jgi:hypothetical protein
MSKNIKTRIQNKRDFECNWLQADFVPLEGELLIYSKETLDNGITWIPEAKSDRLGRTTPITYDRFKVGDGVIKIKDLPFIDKQYLTKSGGELNIDASLSIKEDVYGEGWIEDPETGDGNYGDVVVGSSGLDLDKDKLNFNFTKNNENVLNESESITSNFSYGKDGIESNYNEEFHYAGDFSTTENLKINRKLIEMSVDYNENGNTNPTGSSVITPGKLSLNKASGWYASPYDYSENLQSKVTIDPNTGITFDYPVEIPGSGGYYELTTTTVTPKEFANMASRSQVESLDQKISALASVGLTRKIVAELPSIEQAEENVIYMLGEGEPLGVQVHFIDGYCTDHGYNDLYEPPYVDNDIASTAFNEQEPGIYTFNVDGNGEIWQVTTPNGSKYTREDIENNVGYLLSTDIGINPSSCCSAYEQIITLEVIPYYSSYEEYLFMSGDQRFELIGTTKIDLSDYAEKKDLANYLPKQGTVLDGYNNIIVGDMNATGAKLTDYELKINSDYEDYIVPGESTVTLNPQKLEFTHEYPGANVESGSVDRNITISTYDYENAPYIQLTDNNGKSVMTDYGDIEYQSAQLKLLPTEIIFNNKTTGEHEAVITADSFNNKADKADLSNYATKNTVNDLSNRMNDFASSGLKKEVVESLPSTVKAKENTIYMVASDLKAVLNYAEAICRNGDVRADVDMDWFMTTVKPQESGYYSIYNIPVIMDADGGYRCEKPNGEILELPNMRGIALFREEPVEDDNGDIVVNLIPYESAQPGEEQLGANFSVTLKVSSYDEYLYLPSEQRFELIGNTEVDLSNYLPLTGGRLSGNLKIGDDDGFETHIYNNADGEPIINLVDGTTSETSITTRGIILNDVRNHNNATITAESFNNKAEKSDIKNLESIDGSKALGSMTNKTIAQLQSALDTWLSKVSNVANASANFYAETGFVDKWNSDTSKIINAGVRWTVSIVGSYKDGTYIQLRFSTYSDKQVYYVCKKNNTWGIIKQVAFTDDTATKRELQDIQNNLNNYLPKTDVSGMYLIDTPLNVKTSSKDNYFINKSGDSSLNIRSDVANGTASLNLGQNSEAKYGLRVRQNTDDLDEPPRFDIYDFIGEGDSKNKRGKSIAIYKSVKEIKMDAFEEYQESGNKDVNSGLYIGTAVWPDDGTIPTEADQLGYKLAKVVHARNIGDYAVLKDDQVSIQIVDWGEDD